MEYTTGLFTDFLNELIEFDKNCRSAIASADSEASARRLAQGEEWDQLKNTAQERKDSHTARFGSLLHDFRKQSDNGLARIIEENGSLFTRLQKCRTVLAAITFAGKSITSRPTAEPRSGTDAEAEHVSLDQLMANKPDFAWMSYEVNMLEKSGKLKDAATKYAKFCWTCNEARKLLEAEIESLRGSISGCLTQLQGRYSELDRQFGAEYSGEWTDLVRHLDESSGSYEALWTEGRMETEKILQSSARCMSETLAKLSDTFRTKFPPQVLSEEYYRLYDEEPVYASYECVTEMPRSVHISNMEYDTTGLELCPFTRAFLETHYPFLYRGNKLSIPHCVMFDKNFNYLFRFSESQRQQAVKSACDLSMRLFTMLPPAKLNFMFIDPVRRGDSFALFTQLVDIDDKTSEVINGQIWSNTSDIEDKLKIMTDHISNIIQRCLQGKYDNIYEYNLVAEENAEAYQVIMLMDYPEGMTERSLKLIEQIVTSGPKCGVFMVIYHNKAQFAKISERLHPILKNIESSFQTFDFAGNGSQILMNAGKIRDQRFIWKQTTIPEADTELVISKLRKGIKSAERVVIGIEKLNRDNFQLGDTELSNSTKDGIRIPIGKHGPNKYQYFSLATGRKQHAMVVGVTGAGKSSLLHTIIQQSLSQYSPEELQICLVDFKRGVEFKIYADYELPSFKVIAIETEREFGYNILMDLEHEQKIRADKFNRAGVRTIEQYREIEGNQMPRILVIMDEFHELFSDGNDEIGKKSSEAMERLIRQGRSFGIHLVLASQSYGNISGIGSEVLDQIAVRVVFKCSKADANRLLDNGSAEIDLISKDDPGRAVYNSEAGHKDHNNHFKVAYIDPKKHGLMLQKISDDTRKYLNRSNPTRILLSNIENNRYSIFNQFQNYTPQDCTAPCRLYLGESLKVSKDLAMDLNRSEHANIMMIGGDSEKARSMFTFAMLSLCINHRVRHGAPPKKPFIYLLNYKPLEDSYFTDIPNLMATELLTSYICNVPCWDNTAVTDMLRELHGRVTDPEVSDDGMDRYLFVFGYQRAEILKLEMQNSRYDDVFDPFNMMNPDRPAAALSNKRMLEDLLIHGGRKGVHTILWQDSYQALSAEDNKLSLYFALRIAFDMSAEDYSRFVGENNSTLISKNNAVYYNRAKENQNFRPYQMPYDEWLRRISKNLQ